jgi:hypothetical protein
MLAEAGHHRTRRAALTSAAPHRSDPRGGPVATAEEVRDALFERIAYHAISADTDEVLTLARAYSLLVEEDDDDDEDDEDDDD